MVIGEDAINLKLQGKARSCIEGGYVHDWDAMEHLWSNCLGSLRTASGEFPVLLVDTVHTPMSDREKAAQILFESQGVDSLHFMNSGPLALMASGRDTGLVVDIGEGAT